jgi:hypothetical protein
MRRADLKEIETALTTANDLAIRRALEVPTLSSSTKTAAVPGCGYASGN